MTFSPENLVGALAHGQVAQIASRSPKTELLFWSRDTKNRAQGMLSFPPTAWEGFLRAVQTDNITLK
jgi:hypothetical protein